MDAIEQIFSDNEGNHLLVALYFCDDEYKQHSLHIPEEYSDIQVIDINITKVYVDKPIHFIVFLKMSSWLLEQFEKFDNAVFTFICSTDDLETNHPKYLPQEFRWKLFDVLYNRLSEKTQIRTQDVIVGPEGYQSMGRAFYRDKHAPIISIITSSIQDK